ncbi:MAG: hypothetical protein ACXVNR_06710, partial [Bacteroidia bacterium]
MTSPKKIKFFVTPVYPYGNDHYYHEIIAAAEGFKELGYTVVGNADYWFIPEENKFLIPYEEGNDFDIAIYDYRYVTSFAHLLFRKGYPNFDKRKKHILIDRNDWISPIWINNQHYDIFDLIFAGNLYTTEKYASNIRPWAIGLTNRIMNSIDRFYNEKQKKEFAIGYNFRISHNMRSLVYEGIKENVKKIPLKPCFTEKEFTEEWTEADKFYSKTTINRHFPPYFNIINSIDVFMAFGGYHEYKPLAYQPYDFWTKLKRKPYFYYGKFLKALKKTETPALFVFQTDNFRFWEILYSASCPINLN